MVDFPFFLVCVLLFCVIGFMAGIMMAFQMQKKHLRTMRIRRILLMAKPSRN